MRPKGNVKRQAIYIPVDVLKIARALVDAGLVASVSELVRQGLYDKIKEIQETSDYWYDGEEDADDEGQQDGGD